MEGGGCHDARFKEGIVALGTGVGAEEGEWEEGLFKAKTIMGRVPQSHTQHQAVHAHTHTHLHVLRRCHAVNTTNREVCEAGPPAS